MLSSICAAADETDCNNADDDGDDELGRDETNALSEAPRDNVDRGSEDAEVEVDRGLSKDADEAERERDGDMGGDMGGERDAGEPS